MSSATQSTPTTESTPATESSSPKKSYNRGKTDPAWGHCKQLNDDGSKTKNSFIMCLYCNKIFNGGGINRVKQHLAGVKGDVEGCKRVPPSVHFQMQQNLDTLAAKKRKVQQDYEEDNLYGPEIRCEQQVFMNVERNCDISRSVKRKGKASVENMTSGSGTIGSYFIPRTTPGAQPTIKSALQSKEAKERCDLAISKWMIDAGILFNSTNSAYYQPMIDAIASMGVGYKGPNFWSLRSYLLNKNVQDVKNYVDGFRTTWRESGCTIMADGWTDRCRRTLINFLVYCPRRIVFLKSVDASNVSKTTALLFELFKEVVLFVGVENVVHAVIDNAANYVAAEKLLEKEFPTLYWSPCAAHCINLMLQDFGKLDEVNDIVNHAAKITKYIYNHCYALHLMRKHTNGREILRPAPTRFATNFIALQSILAQKDALRAMVTSKEWTVSAYAKAREAKKFVDLVLDSTFWKECATLVQITEPLVRVLRIVDSEAKPAMGWLYGAIHKARAEMIKKFRRRKKIIKPYLNILDLRWDTQLHKNLHATGFWLNPGYQYDNDEMAKHRHTVSGLLDVIERYSHGNAVLRSKLTGEMRIFRNAEGDFGRKSAISDRNALMPDEWWLCYGSSAPNLQKLAICVLSQTCSASGCERNWSVFEHIHSKKRNRLEHQRLNDLIYVHYNLRLQQRDWLKCKNYDSIDFKDFEEHGNWILEDDPPNLTTEELETFHNKLASLNIQEKQNDDDFNFQKYEYEVADADEVDGQSGGNNGDQHEVGDFGTSNEGFDCEVEAQFFGEDNRSNLNMNLDQSPWDN